MSSRRRKSSSHRQLTTLSQQAPYVISQRLVRMGHLFPSASDRRDLNRMGIEKIAALQEGWLAMTLRMLELQQSALGSWWEALLTPWQPSTPIQWWYRSMVDADSVLASGLRPAAWRVSANARRLTGR